MLSTIFVILLQIHTSVQSVSIHQSRNIITAPNIIQATRIKAVMTSQSEEGVFKSVTNLDRGERTGHTKRGVTLVKKSKLLQTETSKVYLS